MNYIVPILFIQFFVTLTAVYAYKIYRFVKCIYECLEADRCDYGAEDDN